MSTVSLIIKLDISEMARDTRMTGMMLMMKITTKASLEIMPLMKLDKSSVSLCQESQVISTSELNPTMVVQYQEIAKVLLL